VNELPRVVNCDCAHIFGFIIAPKVEGLPVLTVTGKAEAIEDLFTVGTVSPYSGLGLSIDIRPNIDQTLAEENYHVTQSFLTGDRKVVIRVFGAIQPGQQFKRRQAIGCTQDAWESGEMGTRAICPVGSLIIPAVAFLAAPGISAAAGIRGLVCPKWLIFSGFIEPKDLPPLII
jgi:hypothetical protein